MILADTLKLLTTMGPTALAQVLKHSGYTGQTFKAAEFVGSPMVGSLPIRSSTTTTRAQVEPLTKYLFVTINKTTQSLRGFKGAGHGTA